MSTSKLKLEELDAQVEFQIATHQAIDMDMDQFEFQGHIILVPAAIDAVIEMIDNRTYH